MLLAQDIKILYIKVSIERNDLCSGVFYKPTYSLVTCCIFIFASDKYLIPFSQFLTLRRLCRDNGFFQQSEAMSPWLSYFCRLSGHLCAQQIDRQSALQTSQKENAHRIPFFFYISPSQPLSKIHQS